MKLAGIVKDAVLIVVSAMLFGTQLTLLGLCGYAVALTGIGFHHYQSIVQTQPESIDPKSQEPLLNKSQSSPKLALHKEVRA